MRRAAHPAYLIGSSGVPNYGDELILALWLRFLAFTRPTQPTWVDVIDPGVSSVLLAKAHPRAIATDTLWRIARQCAEAPVELQDTAAERFVSQLGTPKADAGLALLKEVASIHLVGGGYLNSVWPTNGLVASLAGHAAQAAAVSAWATGQGLAPMDDAMALRLATALSRFSLVESRQPDLDSRLSAEGVRLGADDAFLGFHPRLAELWSDRRQVQPPAFMVLLQGDLDQPDDRAALIELALDELRSAGWRGEPVGLVEAMPPEDAWPRTYLDAAGVDHVFYSFLDLWQHGLPVRADQYWVSTRFHFHLLASGIGAAGTAISLSQDYYLPKHSSLTELGSGWRIVDTEGTQLTARSAADTARFPERALDLGRQKWTLATQLYPPQRRIGR